MLPNLSLTDSKKTQTLNALMLNPQIKAKAALVKGKHEWRLWALEHRDCPATPGGGHAVEGETKRTFEPSVTATPLFMTVFPLNAP